MMKLSSPFQKKAPLAVMFALCITAGCNQEIPTGPLAEAEQVAAIRAGFTSSGTSAPTTEIEWGPTTATLRGRIVFDGSSKPSDKLLKITKDVQICKPGGKPVYAGSIKIGPNGGLANVVVYVESKHKNMPLAEYAQPPTGEKIVLLDQKNCVFRPHLLAVSVGTTLRVKNSDTVSHNTAIKTAVSYDSGTILGGKEATFKPTRAERKPSNVSCSLHPWMAANIFIHKNGYFAVTDENGNFELKDLPTDGPLNIKIWHERAGGKGGYLKKATLTGSWADKAKPTPTNTGFKIKQLADKEECKHEDFVIKVDESIIK